MPPSGGSCAGAVGLSRPPKACKTKAGEADQQHGPGRRLRHDGTGKREGGVEWALVSNVSADAQPVGIERCVAGPALQISETWREWRTRRDERFRRRQPKKVTVVELNLRHEEIVIGGEREGVVNVTVNSVSSAGDGAVAAGEYVRKGMDSAGLHGVEGGERAQVAGREVEPATRGIATVERDVGGRIDAGRHLRS